MVTVYPPKETFRRESAATVTVVASSADYETDSVRLLDAPGWGSFGRRTLAPV